MKDLTTRALTGVVFLAVMITAIWFSYYTAFLLFLIITSLGTLEFLNLNLEKVTTFKKLTAFIINGIIMLGLVTSPNGYDFKSLGIVLIIFCVTVLFTLVMAAQRKGIHQWSSVVHSLLYVTFPFLALYLLGFNHGEYNFTSILSVFIILWSSDTGAYMFGKFLGKHKFLPEVSPKKTWEGFIGGVSIAVLVAFILQKVGWISFEIPWYALALIVSVFGAFGDLFQSQLKRLKGVKDSGNLMPGHGGILDRFDGLLFCVPVIFAIEKILL